MGSAACCAALRPLCRALPPAGPSQHFPEIHTCLCLLAPAAAEVGSKLVAANLGWPTVFAVLNASYFVLHYMFASQVGGVSWGGGLRRHCCRCRAGWAAGACRCSLTRLSSPPPSPLRPRTRHAQTAHVGALYAAFLAMMLATGVPPVIAALSLGFMSNLFGSITHFGSGQAAVYYGAGRWGG